MNRSRSLLLVLVFVLALAVAQAAHATDGDFDRGFGNGGKFLIPKRLGEFARPTAVRAQPDGKVLVAISRPYFSDQAPTGLQARGAILRLTRRGELDRTFADRGFYRIPRMYPGQPSVLPGGRIVFLAVGDEKDYIVALRPNGKRDTKFSGHGRLSLGGFQAHALELQGSKILLSGVQAGATTTSLARYDRSGAIDRDFGAAGVATIADSVPATGPDTLAVNASGAIFVGLDAYGAQPTNGYVHRPTGVAKLSSRGAPAIEFGVGGVATIPPVGIFFDWLTQLSVAPNGTLGVVTSESSGSKDGRSYAGHIMNARGELSTSAPPLGGVYDIAARRDSNFFVTRPSIDPFLGSLRPDLTYDPDFDATGPLDTFSSDCGFDYWAGFEPALRRKTIAFSDEGSWWCEAGPGPKRKYVMRMLGPRRG